MKLSKLSVSNIMSSVVKYGAHILFAMGIGIMAYLSFVDDLGLAPSLQNITTIALIAMVLNYMVWDSYYISNYNTVMSKDIKNAEEPGGYCIHRRYYNARKTWQYKPLQARIRVFNKEFIDAYIEDIEDITGRKRENIENEHYSYKYSYTKGKKTKTKRKRYPHWKLIWRIKHKKYPKSGIKTARDLLNVLRVGKSGSMSIKVNAAEMYHSAGRIKKLVMSGLCTFLAASLIYDFITGDPKSALLKLALNLVILFLSFFFGSIAGMKGAQIKLSVAEEVSERLEEWKDGHTSEEPYMATAYIEENTHTNNVKESVPVAIEFT